MKPPFGSNRKGVFYAINLPPERIAKLRQSVTDKKLGELSYPCSD
jgi:hypothetical protein